MSQQLISPTLMFAILLAWLSTAVAAEQDEVGKRISIVETQLIEERKSVFETNFPGVVVAADPITLSFQVDGQLIDVAVTEGAFISRGERIASLNTGLFERNVRYAEQSLQRSIRAYESIQSLGSQHVSANEFAARAKAATNIAKSALDDAVADLEQAHMLAPFDAIVADRIASPFTSIKAGAPIVRLVDLSSIVVEFDIPARTLNAVDTEHIKFEVNMAGMRDRLPAKLRMLYANDAHSPGSYRVALSVPTDTGILIPGMTVSVTVGVQMTPFIPRPRRLPSSAIVTGKDRSAYVMVIEKKGPDLFVRQPDAANPPSLSSCM